MKNGCYKLSWRERIGFSAGDLAQNLIYQTVSIWLLFFYTNVYGLKPSVSAVMFLVVRIIDVIWDPIVGAFIDKAKFLYYDLIRDYNDFLEKEILQTDLIDKYINFIEGDCKIGKITQRTFNDFKRNIKEEFQKL